jgi:hypothetical protein
MFRLAVIDNSVVYTAHRPSPDLLKDERVMKLET